MDPALLVKFIQETQLLLSPKRQLSTFGATRIRYHLVSPIDELERRTRLREGLVISERPLILTADALRERFEGFGEESREFARWLSQEYRDLLRALEYKFKNQDQATRVLREDPRVVSGRIRKELEERSPQDSVLIRCPDAAWSFALMRYTLEEASRSFPGNVKDLERRGYFEPGGPQAMRRRAEIESLFERAAGDAFARQELGRKLKEYGLFEELEDRFLSLFR